MFFRKSSRATATRDETSDAAPSGTARGPNQLRRRRSRRELLKLGAVAAAGAVGGVLLPRGVAEAHGGIQGDGLGAVPGVHGTSEHGPGVFGESGDGTGVAGQSVGGPGVRGTSQDDAGVRGSSQSAPAPAIVGSWNGPSGTHHSGVFGTTTGNTAGVQGAASALGVLGSARLASDPALTGGTGVRDESGSGTGVEGRSGSGPGVRGESANGPGVRGTSQNGAGVSGSSQSASTPAITGSWNGTPASAHAGVFGSTTGNGPEVPGVQGVGPALGVLGVARTTVPGDPLTDGTGVRAGAAAAAASAARAAAAPVSAVRATMGLECVRSRAMGLRSPCRARRSSVPPAKRSSCLAKIAFWFATAL